MPGTACIEYAATEKVSAHTRTSAWLLACMCCAVVCVAAGAACLGRFYRRVAAPPCTCIQGSVCASVTQMHLPIDEAFSSSDDSEPTAVGLARRGGAASHRRHHTGGAIPCRETRQVSMAANATSCPQKYSLACSVSDCTAKGRSEQPSKKQPTLEYVCLSYTCACPPLRQFGSNAAHNGGAAQHMLLFTREPLATHGTRMDIAATSSSKQF